MENMKTRLWLKEKQIELGESFHDAFRRLLDEYLFRHPGMSKLQVYHEMGVSKQCLYWWERHSNSVQSKCNYKRDIILAAAGVFGLNETEAEKLANQAGLSLKICDSFHQDLRNAVSAFEGGIKQLCRSTLISERMMEYFLCESRSCIPSKPCVIAVALALGMSESGLQSFHQ